MCESEGQLGRIGGEVCCVVRQHCRQIWTWAGWLVQANTPPGQLARYESGTGTLAQVQVEQADVDMCTGRLVLANITVIDKQGKV